MERDLSDPEPTVDLLSEQTGNHGTQWDTMHARKKTFSLRLVRTRMARHKLRASTASNGTDGKGCVDNNAGRGKYSTLAAPDRHSQRMELRFTARPHPSLDGTGRQGKQHECK
ncbi:hypothetical protein LTR66_016782 [Elasticomyces elasticus]|nr:hypothetical protein LTR66_016782 [Elasticomyces elasticus]